MRDTPALTGITLYYAIRAMYPNPSRRAGPQSYCVGGALLKFLEPIDGAAFPASWWLGQLLRRANPGLNDTLAYFYAGNIVRRNDRGDYEGAWKQLRLALTHESAPRIDAAA